MMFWTPIRVARALGRPSVASFTGIGTDSRSLIDRSLFVALEGDRFDGHDFLDDAKTAGAIGAVVRHGTPPMDGLELIHVDDPLMALGALARERRRSLWGPVVAITGSNGKTSTKEMVAAVLSCQYRVHATTANLNNRIGVPLTILGAPDDTEALVVEAGANMIGEIAQLRAVIEPTIGVVTNVAAAHLEGFGDIDAVVREKVSLLEHVPVAVVGLQPPTLAQKARDSVRRVIVVGDDPAADIAYTREPLDQEGYPLLTYGGEAVRLSTAGHHQATNALMAVTVGMVAGVEASHGLRAVARVTVPGGRLRIRRFGNLVVVDDTYNANPESVLASLRTAREIAGDRRLIVVVGSMLELGSAAPHYHESVAREVLDMDPYLIGAIGLFAPAFRAVGADMTRVLAEDDVGRLGGLLRQQIIGDEVILLKASRGVGLERIIPFLEEGEISCSTTS